MKVSAADSPLELLLSSGYDMGGVNIHGGVTYGRMSEGYGAADWRLFSVSPQ